MKLILREQKTHNYGYLKRIFLVPQHGIIQRLYLSVCSNPENERIITLYLDYHFAQISYQVETLIHKLKKVCLKIKCCIQTQSEIMWTYQLFRYLLSLKW